MSSFGFAPPEPNPTGIPQGVEPVSPVGWIRGNIPFGTGLTGLPTSGTISAQVLDMEAYLKDAQWGKTRKERMGAGIMAMFQYYVSRYQTAFTGALSPNAMADQAIKAFLRFDAVEPPSMFANNPNTYFRHQYVNLLWSTSLIVLGEFISRPFDFRIKANSPTAESRKEETRLRMLLDRRIKEIAQQVQLTNPQLAAEMIDVAQSELMAPQDYDPYSPQGIEEYLDERNGKYRDVLCDYIHRDLTRWMLKTDFKQWLWTTFMKYWLTQRAHANPYVDESCMDVVSPQIDPRNVLLDPQVRSEFFDDQNFEVFMSYMSVNDALAYNTNITREDLLTGVSNIQTIFGVPVFTYDDNKNIDSILVVEFNFRSTENKVKYYDVELDDATLEFDGENFVYQEGVSRREAKMRYEQIYYGIFLGGWNLVDWGVKPYQIRSVYNPAKAQFNSTHLMLYNSLADSANPPATNFHRICKLEDDYNHVYAKMMDMLSKIDGSKLAIRTGDFAILNEGISPFENAKLNLEFMKRENIIFVNDSAYDNQGKLAIEVVDFNGQNMNYINGMLSILNQIRSEINLFMNITPARSGDQGQYTAATIGLQNKQQSDFATAFPIQSFGSLVNKHLTKVANLLKLILPYRMKLAQQMNNQNLIDVMDITLGEVESQIYDDIILQDFSIEVEFGNSNQQALQAVQMAAQQQAANGGISMRQLAAIMAAPNVDAVIDELEVIERKQKRDQLEMQRMQMQQQAAMANQMGGTQGVPTPPPARQQSEEPLPETGRLPMVVQ